MQNLMLNRMVKTASRLLYLNMSYSRFPVEIWPFDRSRPPEAADFATAAVWGSRFDAEFEAESNGGNRIAIAPPEHDL